MAERISDMVLDLEPHIRRSLNLATAIAHLGAPNDNCPAYAVHELGWVLHDTLQALEAQWERLHAAAGRDA